MFIPASILLTILLFISASASPLISPRDGNTCTTDLTVQSLLTIRCAQDADHVTTNLWTNRYCVAAAIISGVGAFSDRLDCLGHPIDTAKFKSLPHLDYSIYAEFVGKTCAYKKGGACPITTQNAVDFVYSSLTQAKSDIWPTSPSYFLSTSWQPILDWTKQTKTRTIPYKNFDDWLHYSFAAGGSTSNPPTTCTISGQTASCTDLIKGCNKATPAKTDNLWSIPSCVAAAICGGPTQIIAHVKCSGKVVPAQGTMNLDYKVYASIVGKCAYDKGGCPVTNQNFIDFYYGQLSAVHSTNFPKSSSDVMNVIWYPGASWLKNVGKSTSYLQLADYLKHFTFSTTPGSLGSVWSETTSDEVNRWLDSHNAERRKHSAPIYGWVSSAADAAQYWVNKCDNSAAPAIELSTWGEFGQSMFIGRSTPSRPLMLETIMNIWIQESLNYNYSTPGYSPDWSHWSQIVWKSTDLFGCSSKLCSTVTNYESDASSLLTLCLYQPPGNTGGAAGFRANVLPEQL